MHFDLKTLGRLAQWAWERRRTLELLSKSRARKFELPGPGLDVLNGTFTEPTGSILAVHVQAAPSPEAIAPPIEAHQA